VYEYIYIYIYIYIYKFTFYLVVISLNDGQYLRPKNFVCVRNKQTLQHLWCCIVRITIADVKQNIYFFF
jgi:hypothetical protein